MLQKQFHPATIRRLAAYKSGARPMLSMAFGSTLAVLKRMVATPLLPVCETSSNGIPQCIYRFGSTLPVANSKLTILCLIFPTASIISVQV